MLLRIAPRIDSRSCSRKLLSVSLACAALLPTACVPVRTAPSNMYAASALPRAGTAVSTKPRVEILNPLLAERIQHISRQSPSFRGAWSMIQSSGVRVRIGTYRQLQNQLPRWYRDHPDEWGGVTVMSADVRARLDGAVVAVRIAPLQDIARQLPSGGDDYVLSQIDRILIHEIYGHLTPVIATRDPAQECPDQLRAGEVTPCVQVRERQVAAELARYRQADARADARNLRN
ncbi:MAG TPA: hypothetical protein VGD27_18065 [Longimicrobiales bacterium]